MHKTICRGVSIIPDMSGATEVKKNKNDEFYTPKKVYDAVREWVVKEYNIGGCEIVRPFYPGGDYERYAYPDDCVVLDNPPFSILAKICEFYLERGIKFFLFAPSLTCLSPRAICMRVNHIISNSAIMYDNGKVVMTAFLTNLGDDKIIAQTAPTLMQAIDDACKTDSRSLPAYQYPDNVLTASMMQKYCENGIEVKIKKKECMQIVQLDDQKKYKKTVFGGGLLLSSSGAAKKQKAEGISKSNAGAGRNNKYVKIWHLSCREKKLIHKMDYYANQNCNQTKPKNAQITDIDSN